LVSFRLRFFYYHARVIVPPLVAHGDDLGAIVRVDFEEGQVLGAAGCAAAGDAVEQHDSAVAWTAEVVGDVYVVAPTRKTMIVALARKLLIALWRFVTTGETLDGVILRPAG